MKNIAMIPARGGSQRLKRKNLKKLLFEGTELTLIEICVIKCLRANVFDEVWVNSEDEEILNLAQSKGAYTYTRNVELADNISTHNEFVKDFLETVTCDNLFQIHTIAPLLSIEEIQNFVTSFIASDAELGMSVENIELECLYKDKPLNFSFNKKQNSQELTPVQKISWSMTAWKSKTFPHHDTTFTFPISKLSALVIKTQEDFDICQSLYNLSNKN